MLELKKQNKELSDSLDQYLDQIHELESQNKGLQTMNKMVEQYKNKAVELEREKFELVSASQVSEHEVKRLTAELEKSISAKHAIEDELMGLRGQMERYGTSLEDEGDEAGLSYEIDTVPKLREKLRTMEREVNALRKLKMSSSSNDSLKATDIDNNDLNTQISLLTDELEDIRQIKVEREEALIAAKKQIAELQGEVMKYN